MTREKQITTLRPSSSSVTRRQPLMEVVGGTTAECAAVCCCCPCGLVNLLVLATCKVPAGLWRKALRWKRRRRLLKMGLLPSAKCTSDDKDFQIHPAPDKIESSAEVMELDKEMFDQFYSGGFWRSSSDRM